MKVINLIEDTQGDGECLFEHGLSFYVETANHKLLLDTGASDAFITNAKTKGIDLTKIDTVVISHGHYDHTGGLLEFAELNPRAKIYIRKNAVDSYYNLKNGIPKYIGMDARIASSEQVVWVGANLKIDGELSLFTGVTGRRCWPLGNNTLKKKAGDDFVQDTFDHEQYLVVTEGKTQVLLSGCAHNGILNILDEYRAVYGGAPNIVISGFHTAKPEYTAEDDRIINAIARELKETDTLYFSGHCTGEYPMQLLKEVMGERLVVMHSGDELKVGEILSN